MFAVTVCAMLALAIGAWAQRVYPIYELTDEALAVIDIHDGTTEDWIDVIGEPTVTALEFEADPEFGPYDPFSMDFRIWMAWHDATDRIFFAMERSDDIYVNEYPRDAGDHPFFHDSMIAVYIDGDRSGGPEDYSAGEVQRYFAMGEVFGDDLPQLMDYGFPSFYPFTVVPPFADVGGGSYGESPTISVVEFYVTAFDDLEIDWRNQRDNPEQAVVSDLQLGKVIGFSILVFDVEPLEEWKTMLRLSENSPNSMTDPDNFVHGFLVGPGGELPPDPDSAVEHITWARIKAQF